VERLLPAGMLLLSLHSGRLLLVLVVCSLTENVVEKVEAVPLAGLPPVTAQAKCRARSACDGRGEALQCVDSASGWTGDTCG